MRGSIAIALVIIGVLAVASIPVVVAMRSSRGPGADFSAPGPRIIAMSPAIAATLVDLGLGDRIVGRHAYDLALDKSVPVVGDNTGIDYEALTRARPTHILTQWGTRGVPERLTRLAERHGWIVMDFRLLSLEDTLELVDACESIDPAHSTGQARRALADAWAPEPSGFGAAGRILMLWSSTPPAAAGPGSFHHEVLERLGGSPAVTTGNHYIQLDAEDVLRLAPDGIVLIMPRDPGTPASARDPAALAARLGPLAGLTIPAIDSGRIAIIDDPLVLLPGTPTGRFAEQLRAVLREWMAHPLSSP